MSVARRTTRSDASPGYVVVCPRVNGVFSIPPPAEPIPASVADMATSVPIMRPEFTPSTHTWGVVSRVAAATAETSTQDRSVNPPPSPRCARRNATKPPTARALGNKPAITAPALPLIACVSGPCTSGRSVIPKVQPASVETAEPMVTSSTSRTSAIMCRAGSRKSNCP